MSVQSHLNIITNSKLLNPQWFVGVHSDLARLVKDIIGVLGTSPLIQADWDPRHIYRSIPPFLPPSSSILVHYNNLSDPIRVLRVCSRTNEDNNNFHVLRRGDTPISAVTCTALSGDGHRVALGFDNGVVEVVDTELGTTFSRSELLKPPVWLLFTNGGHKLVTETSDGDIYILDNFILPRPRFASRIDGSTTVVASLSHDGSMIVRAAQHSTKEWYENMYIIHITTDSPTIHSLSTPSYIIPYRGTERRFPLQRSVGFSPNGQYAAAFDTTQAFVWSCTSFQLIAHYSIEDPDNWFLNTNRPSTMPTLALPNDVIITPFPEHSGSIHSTSCILFNLGQRHLTVLSRNRMHASSLAAAAERHLTVLSSHRMHASSLAAAAAPVLDSRRRVWFRGREIMIIPDNYWNSIEPVPPFAPSFWELPSDFPFLTSKDGTLFLLYKERWPVLVDISGVISYRTT